jgi:hypothetical protein
MLQLPVLPGFTGDFYQPFTTANYVGDKLYGALFKGTESLAQVVMHKHLNL